MAEMGTSIEAGMRAASGTDATTAMLLEYLKSHDVACPLCKYNLRNLSTPRCPECGREIRLTVGLKEPHLRWLVLFLVGLCLSAGCGIFSAVVVLSLLARGRNLPSLTSEPGICFLLYATALSIVPAFLGVVLFRIFIRLSKWIQIPLALLAWLWDGLLFLVLLLLVFRVIR